ncbi:MAG: hypothetical protein IIZ93_00625 [Acidaminococcaceae bacterium]|nr:hypothetical protein [Acidaminococcaceae bacterium]
MERLTYRDDNGRALLTHFGKQMYCSTQATADCVCMLEERLEETISLLEAQEPRVLTADELKEYLMINDSGLLSHDQWRELSQRAPLYMEFREPYEYQVNWLTVERLRPWAMESMFWEKYKIDLRCWSARPTEEDREKVKWYGE